MPRLKKKSVAQKQAENKASKRNRREDPVYREAEQSTDADARMQSRLDPARREAEQSVNTEARKQARLDQARREMEQSANTEAHKQARLDQARREAEQSADREARQKARLDRTRREAEQSMNTEARKQARLDQARREAEQSADREARQKARLDRARREAEQSMNTEARKQARLDQARREMEQSANTEARKQARLDQARREAEQTVNTEAHKTSRLDQTRREAEQSANTEARRIVRLNAECKRSEQENQKITRQGNKPGYDTLLALYRENIKCAPSFVCSCCGCLWYKTSTTMTTIDKLSSRGCSEEFIQTVLNFDQETHRLCCTCKAAVYTNKVPKLCLKNGFDFPLIPDELKNLSPLEERLVALRLPFMQIRLLGSERQSVLKGNVVNVETDLNICAAVLPRSFHETSTIQVQLMRKMAYQRPYMYETIRPLKVYQAAKFLINSEVYKSENVILSEDWSRYQESDTLNFVCSEPEPGTSEAGDDIQPATEPDDAVVDVLPDSGADETLIFSEKETAGKYCGIRIAPAEGNTPIALHRDVNADVMSFPSIYCGQERVFKEGVKISYTDIAKSELLRYDRRACLPVKVLHSFKRSFNEKVIQAIQICLRKTNQNEKLTASCVLKIDSIRNLLESDDGYAVFKNLRSSPSYWKQKSKKVLAMVRQIGKPAFFITLSAAETKWTELLVMLFKILKNEDITEEDVSKLPFDQISELIRNDPVTCMRNFEHRLRELMKLIHNKKNPSNGLFAPYEIEDHFSRLEFQMRGSPHSHGLYWIKDAPVFIEEDEDSINSCIDFIDEFITCERSEDGEMEKLIGYQIHKHSHTCVKRSKKCRFGFPKPPLDSTRILSPLPKDYDSESKKRSQELFTRINDTLDGYGRGFKENKKFDLFLASLDSSYGEYIFALRSSIKRNTVFLKRKTSAIFVNAYNRKLLEAWGANIDVQFVLDTYACAKYCVGYILKGEGGVSKLLQVLTQDVKRGNISAREQVKKFASVLINGSEISAQEATAFLLGTPNTNSSRQDVFINTAPPMERISILKPNDELEKLPEDSQDIMSKGLIDHYTARPIELQNICLAEFASLYEFTKKVPKVEDETMTEITNSKYIRLTDHSGFIKKRLVRKVIRYRHYGKKEDMQNYSREQLMLFWPWSNEEEQLLSHDVINIADQHRLEILENSKPFIYNREVDDNILGELMNEIEDECQRIEDNSPLLDEDLENFGEEQSQFHDFSDVLGSGSSKIEQFLPPKMVDEEQYLKIMRSLNEKQQRFVLNNLFMLKTSSTPFFNFLSGGAGVGKSHVVTAIVQSYLRYFSKLPSTNPEQLCVLVSAPTGKAAFNVFGMTLHCTFKLPPTQYAGRVCNLEDGAVNALRSKLERTKLFIIDEISMVSVKQLYDIDQRLRQIFCTTEDFGGKSLIVVGHLRQLPPIGGSYVFKDPTHIPLGQLVGNHLWQNFGLYELDEIMRQKGELEFCKALNNMSEGVMDPADIALIRSREINDSNQPPKVAIHLFQTNDECNIYNMEVHGELDTEGAMSIAYDKIQGVGSDAQKKELREYAKNMDRQKTDGLPYKTHLQVTAEYFVSTNIDVADGLFNGSTGSLKHIEYGTTAANVRLPTCAWIDFRNPLIGSQKRSMTKAYQQRKGINRDWVPIQRITRNLSKTHRHGSLEIIRTQIPLIAANGMTIAKSQGSSLPTVVVHIKRYRGKLNIVISKVFRERKLTRENLYVACSRATSINGFFIQGQFVPPEKPPPDDPVSHEMARLRNTTLKFSIKYLQDYDDTYEKLYFHNIQSFVAHHRDIEADYSSIASNIIALVEPHLIASDVIMFNNFSCAHRTNCRGIRNSEGALLLQKNNGTTIDATIRQQFTTTGHCLFLCFAVSGVNAIMTYKSPAFARALFYEQLSDILGALNGNILVFGDININLQTSEGKNVKELFKRFGLMSILPAHTPSTDGGTQIDCCFTNFKEIEAWYHESYYSYHKPICMIWPKP